MTPLVSAPRLAGKIGIGSLWLKLESMNPTGSFKDRGLSVAVTYALEHGAHGVVGASSGNALHAQAAYAALAGLPSIALVPKAVPTTRLMQPSFCCTRVARIRGDYSQCHQLAQLLTDQMGYYNTSTTYENPISPEGYKTVAYELWRQMEEGPDWIVIPVGAGPLLAACARGFAELAESNIIEGIPALLGVQSTACAPITSAFDRGEVEVQSWEGVSQTIARGIADPLRGYAVDGTYTLRWVKRSVGAMISVDDEAIVQATRVLGQLCGVYAEPSAAASVAGLVSAIRRGIVPKQATAVCLITGTGFKEVSLDVGDAGASNPLAPDVEAIEAWLRRR